MGAHGLYRIDLWVLAAGALATFVVAGELGFRFGARERARHGGVVRGNLSTLQAAVLTLLALLLGFSFAMAQGRYETRRQLVLEEANAIGTALLRTRMLDQPERGELATLLREYVDARVLFASTASPPRRRQAANEEAVRLQAQMWDAAVRASAHSSNQIASGLFVASLNEVFDLQSARLAALENYVPSAIIVLIFTVGLIAAALVGYGCGLDNLRKFGLTFLAAVVFVAVGALVIDLDRPYRGLIQVPQQSMLRLRQSMQAR